MYPLATLAPAWIAFEVLQLVVCERYIGIKPLQAGMDPKRTGPAESLSMVWVLLIVIYWLWMIAMLVSRIGTPQVVALLGVSGIGFALRRASSLKYVLVILTFEGAIRIGMLVSLSATLWRTYR